ncbi:conserved exported hypothetical protein [Tenacibaculum litopenaei]|uniref:DUF4252 domain-containing protein n=1 Tax=Tenacibaculum litopenaei TaxID=396016 RepID=UPI003895610F
MKKIYFLAALCISLISVSCNDDSLQSYLVKSQDKQGFITLDIPASVVELNTANATDEEKAAYESIRKINITGLPYANTDEATYEAEKAQLLKILKKSKYKRLMNMKKDGVSASIYYTGEAKAINEIIAFGYGKEFGVGVARILGKNMNPAKIMDMMKKAKVDVDGVDFKQLQAVLNNK